MQQSFNAMFDESKNWNAKEADFCTLKGRRNVYIVLQCYCTIPQLWDEQWSTLKKIRKFLSQKLFLEFLWYKNLLSKQMLNMVVLSEKAFVKTRSLQELKKKSMGNSEVSWFEKTKF